MKGVKVSDYQKLNSLKWKERKGGKEAEREREKDEESMRIGKERKSP